jgi:hypothetical protein
LLSASLVLTEFREITDEALQLIEMRYQHMLALMDLELLFADGQLDCMWRSVTPPPSSASLSIPAVALLSR